MTWIKKIPPAHRCRLPRGPLFGRRDWVAGSLWECDDCGQRWVWYAGPYRPYWLRSTPLTSRLVAFQKGGIVR